MDSLFVDVKGPSAHDEVRAVLTAPDAPWSTGVRPSDITITTISGGITNALYKCALPFSTGREPVLVRVYGEKTELIINRDKDNEVFKLLAKTPIGVPFLGLFGNGRIEGYVSARPLEPVEMGDREPVDVLSAIAVEVARLHALDVPGLPGKRSEPVLWAEYLDKWLVVASEASFDVTSADPVEANKAAIYATLDIPTIARALGWLKSALPSPSNGHGQAVLEARAKELDTAGPPASGHHCASAVARCVGALDVPISADPLVQARLDAAAVVFSVVFGHNDLLSGNVLISEPEHGEHEGALSPTVPRGRVQLIDYEYAGFNYFAFDVANHFCEHCGFEFVLSQLPGREAQYDWFRAYLRQRGIRVPTRASYKDEVSQASSQSAGSGSASGEASAAPHSAAEGEDDVSAAFLDELYMWVNRSVPLSDAFWGLWAVLQARHSAIDFDFIGYAQRRLSALHGHVREFWGTPGY